MRYKLLIDKILFNDNVFNEIFLSEGEPISTEEIAELVGKEPAHLESYLEELLDRKLILKHGETYSLNKENKTVQRYADFINSIIFI